MPPLDGLCCRELHLHNAPSLYRVALYLADIVIPQEYGITQEEKLDISKKTCPLLVKKITADLKHTFFDGDTDFLHRLDPECVTMVTSACHECAV